MVVELHGDKARVETGIGFLMDLGVEVELLANEVKWQEERCIHCTACLARNVADLMEAIMAYLNNHNQNHQVFVWSAPVEHILTKIAKCKEVLDSLH